MLAETFAGIFLAVALAAVLAAAAMIRRAKKQIAEMAGGLKVIGVFWQKHMSLLHRLLMRLMGLSGLMRIGFLLTARRRRRISS